MKELIEMHLDCVEQVYKNDYYLNVFQYVGEKTGLMFDNPDTGCIDDVGIYRLDHPEKIVSFWNKFWYALPDNRAIHRHPFNLICDICEYDYREE